MTQHTIRTETAKRHLHKYRNRNPLHRWTINRFFDALARELVAQKPASVLDFGCGEAFLLDELAQRCVSLPSYTGIDVRQDALESARARYPNKTFLCVDLFDPCLNDVPADLVLAVQVLEHLAEPNVVLERLTALEPRRLLITVPYEPWFRLCNLLRGRDLRRLGNHPEHIQHWSPNQFSRFVAPFLNVEKVETIFPFILLLAHPRTREI